MGDGGLEEDGGWAHLGILGQKMNRITSQSKVGRDIIGEGRKMKMTIF